MDNELLNCILDSYKKVLQELNKIRSDIRDLKLQNKPENSLSCNNKVEDDDLCEFFKNIQDEI